MSSTLQSRLAQTSHRKSTFFHFTDQTIVTIDHKNRGCNDLIGVFNLTTDYFASITMGNNDPMAVQKDAIEFANVEAFH
ncbi:MAG: hypothetical protein JWN40_3040 [Phycisphaerales bacterium]|nr:hypothetical protein [Phycisphaerales bacterium]